MSSKPGKATSCDDISKSQQAGSSIPVTTQVKKKIKQVANPTPSASIILVSPANKILLLHRVSTSSTFPSAHVFPGGMLEPSDGEVSPISTDPARHRDNIAYRTGAIRELFEESGILLARPSSTSTKLLSLPLEIRSKGRRSIHRNTISIKSWLSQQSPSAILDTKSLIPFSRWISPITMPKRFTTQVYLYFLPISLEGIDKSDNFTAISDDIETKSAEWAYAIDWTERATKGEIILHATQFTLLSIIGQFLKPPNQKPITNKNEDEPNFNTTFSLQRRNLLTFITTPNPIQSQSNSPSPHNHTQPWTHKTISPRPLPIPLKDNSGRSVVGLDWPGPELENVEGISGHMDHVVLVRYDENGAPRGAEFVRRGNVIKVEGEKEEEKEERSGSGGGNGAGDDIEIKRKKGISKL